VFNTLKALTAAALLVVAGAAQADTYMYICMDHGKAYPLKVDDKKNTLIWQGNTYKLKLQETCAKYGWHAEKGTPAGEPFDFCTSTKGGGYIGPDIDCNIFPE
jgi:hypothetical protein